MALTTTLPRLTAIAARLLPLGIAVFSILVAACNNGSGSGGSGY
jgi:predicted small secreted protein